MESTLSSHRFPMPDRDPKGPEAPATEAAAAPAPRRRPTPTRALLLAAVALGAFARFDGLGTRQLAVDEYFFATSVQAVLESGLPELPGGGYYARGLLPQYVTALSVAALGETEFAQRLPAVLFGLLTVWLAYRYAASTAGAPLAAAVAAVLLLSSWEVEFSRFIRMYAAFQCATLAFLLALQGSFFGATLRRRYLPAAAAVAATLCHTLGVLLFPLLFLPLAVPTLRRRFGSAGSALRYFAVTSVVSAAAVWFARYDFRSIGIAPPYPDGWSPTFLPAVHVPPFPFWHVGGPTASLVVAVLLIALAGGGVALAGRMGTKVRESDAVAAMFVVASAVHALTVALALGVLLVVRYGFPARHGGRTREAVALAVGSTVAAAWILIPLVTGAWGAMATPPATIPGVIRNTLFSWPNLYEPLIYPWSLQLPVFGAAIALATVVRLVAVLREPWGRVAGDPAVLLVLLVLTFGLLRSFYLAARYTYSLYPLGVLVVGLGVRSASARLLAGRSERTLDAFAVVAMLALFAVGGDFHPRHLTHVPALEYSYRVGEVERFAGLWYPRHDFRTPAEALERDGRVRSEDRIVVAGQEPVSAVLSRPHAVFYDRDADVRYAEVSRDRGTVELWSGQRLLGTREELRTYTSGAPTVWLLRSATGSAVDPDVVWGDRLAGSERVSVGLDGRVELLRLSLRRD